MAWFEEKEKCRGSAEMEKTRDGLGKCNFDAAWDEQLETGGVGVVIRNEVGEFVAAMAKQHTGICSLLLTETMAA